VQESEGKGNKRKKKERDRNEKNHQVKKKITLLPRSALTAFGKIRATASLHSRNTGNKP